MDADTQKMLDRQREIMKSWLDLCDLILELDSQYSVLPVETSEKLKEVRFKKP